MPERRKVVVIGSGPAGLTAALYSARAQLEPLVIEGEPSSTSDQPGGQLMLTTDVENYPGFVDGVMGPELMGMMRAQALRFEAELRTAKVSRVNLASWPFEVWIGDPEADEPTVLADTLIIATGARSLMLGCPNEDRLLGYGVSTCATCDGFFFREQHIAVAGGGDSALEEALFLTRFASKVTVVHRRDELRASKIMQERAFKNPKIEFRWNSVITGVLGDTKVSGVELRDTVTGEDVRARRDRPLRGHRARAQQLPVQGPARAGGQRLRPHLRRHHPHQRGRGLRRRRRAGRLLPPGHHLGRVGLHGRHRRRTLARRARRVAGNRTGWAGVTPSDKEIAMSEKIETLTDATFDEHVKASDVPVLVDFWAEWCGPCKMISPVLEEIAEEQAGKIRIGKLNIDDNLDVTRRFDVMSIPTLILFKDGEPAVRLIGAKPKGQLLEEISAYL